MPGITTRIFRNGNSQAVRIPADLKLDADTVQIFRNADGDLVIRPVRPARGRALVDALQGFDDDFIAALEAARDDPLPVQEREAL
ncbi:MAG: AbrB/MazE/SpoVT family DNA-binding domain-containing protein [Burkholderiales bacterium]|nr:AbrB/MazE/SpoVT family DNA-binding domain-containing protein [Burkholderiales bacterium]